MPPQRQSSDSPPSSVFPSNLIFDVKSSYAPKQQGQQSSRRTKKTARAIGNEEQPSMVQVKDSMDAAAATIGEDVLKDETLQANDEDALRQEKLNDTNNYNEEEENRRRHRVRVVIPLPDRLNAKVHYGKDGSLSGTFPLEESVFGIDPIRIDLMKQAVDYIRAKIRGRRKNVTKTISQVSGSGRKVRQQKGTGSARAGHSRPNHWRGGAKAHGPKGSIQDYGKIQMTKKMRQLAMSSVLSQKLKEGNLILMDCLCLDSHKTQPWANVLNDAFGIGRMGSSALIVDHYYPAAADAIGAHDESSSSFDKPEHGSYNGVPINLWVASSNIPKVKVVNPSFVNVYEILKKEKLVMTLEALKIFEQRLKR
jgi:large subunit ribosomal protein L4